MSKIKFSSGFSLQSFINCSLVLLIISALTLCGPPYGNRGRHRDRHYHQHDEHYYSEETNGQAYPRPGPDYPKSSNPPIPVGGTTLEIYPSGIKISPDQNPQSQDGDLTIKVFPQDGINQKPSLCPEGFGIYRQTGQCYKFTKAQSSEEVSPCGQFMAFYQTNSDPQFGECDCKEQHLLVPRPIVFWERTAQCYWLFDKGPCNPEEWLVLNEKDTPICRPRSCPENLPEDWSAKQEDSHKRKYWFRNRGKCYKSDSKGFCENPDNNIYLVFKEQGYTTECKGVHIDTKNIVGGGKTLPCLPGHRATVTGECRRSLTFE